MVNRSLMRFAAQVSITLYIVLLFAEYLRPGFVSTVMNVHVMWLVIVPLILTSDIQTTPDPHSPRSLSSSSAFGRRRVSEIGFAMLGIVLGLIVWHVGEVFGGARFWFAVAVGITPLALFRYTR